MRATSQSLLFQAFYLTNKNIYIIAGPMMSPPKATTPELVILVIKLLMVKRGQQLVVFGWGHRGGSCRLWMAK